ncbi:unnamed protein product, partial [Polarella glacialis]
FEIVSGTFTCEDEYIIDGKVIIPDEEDSSGPEACEVACKSKSGCLFFFEGEVAIQKQCRLYTACNTLVREPGLIGTLKAMPTPQKQYCRVADPEKCWAVSGRRSLLRASRAEDRLSCEWMDLISQCDHKLLMGGAGVEKCARCAYKDASTQSFIHKTVIPTSFAHGQKLGVSCWQERFRAAPVASGSRSGGETLTCVSGSWMDTSGQPGLSNFACGACLQVVSPPYMQLDSRNQQELYFASILEVQIKTMSKKERSMLRSGILFPFIMKSCVVVGDDPSPSPLLGECEGDCDRDDHCATGLKCFQRAWDEPIPGCKGNSATLAGYYDFCYDPAKAIHSAVVVGVDPSALLGECEGDCDHDDQCATGLKCFQRGGDEPISGCKGNSATMATGYDFCYDPAWAQGFAGYIDNMIGAIYSCVNVGDDPSPSPLLGECEGDCDRDDHCATGLKCFQRGGDEPIPGCEGAKFLWDYCYDPAKAFQLGSNLDLSFVGFVMKTVPTAPSTKKVVESTGSPGTCLEVDPTRGLKATKCSDPPNDRQLISAGDLPKLMGTLFSAATQGLVPPLKEFETSKEDAGLKDFLLEQNCEENALSAFGFRDKDANGKLEIFADCSQAT